MSEIVFYEEDEKKVTFIVDIMYNKNHSWQGKLKCLEEKKERSFRSTLELVRMIDDTVKKNV